MQLYVKSISVDNLCMNHILQHAKSKEYVRMRNVIFCPGQSKLTAIVTEDEEQPGTSSATTMEVSYDSFIVLTESRNYLCYES